MEFIVLVIFALVVTFLLRDHWPVEPVKPGTYAHIGPQKEEEYHPATARKRRRSNLTTWQRRMRRQLRRGLR